MTTRRRLYRRVAIGASTALFGLLAQPATAQADQISDMKARASQLAAQIDSLGLKESALSEQYDKSVLAQQQAEQAVTAAKQTVQAATAAAQQASQAVKRDAIQTYMGNDSLTSSTGGNVRSAQQALLRREYASMVTASEQDDLDRYRTSKLQAQSAEQRLASAAQRAASQVATVKKAETSVQQAQTSLQNTYSQVQGQLATLVAQAEAARQAEQQRQAQQALAAQQAAARQALAAQQIQPAPARPTASPAPAIAAPSGVPSIPTQTAVPSGSGGAAAVAAGVST